MVLNGAPSCMVAAPGGGWLIGLDQAGLPALRCAVLDQHGQMAPFPTESMASAAPGEVVPLNAVEDVQTGPDDLVWLLDNGRRSETTPKLLGWNSDKKTVASVINLAGPAILQGSFLSEMALDPKSALVVLSDPANDTNAALLLLDRPTGILRRVLQGHVALRPDPSVALPSSGAAAKRRLDGRATIPHTGVRSIKIDDDGEWLYFAPIRTKKLYRLSMKLLRDSKTPSEVLAAAVQVHAEIGPCSALAVDEDSNVYVGDMRALGVCVVSAKDKAYRPLVTAPELLCPDGLTFGPDGQLYFFSRAGGGLRSRDSAQTQHRLYRIKPLAEGIAGR
jgi:hypothetical protein